MKDNRDLYWTLQLYPLTRISVFLGGTVTEMVGVWQEFSSKSRVIVRPSVLTTWRQPETAGQKEAFTEPGREVR